MLYFWKGNDTRSSKIMLPGVWLTNTQIQIHECTNTALIKVADRHDMCYIFEKVIIPGPQKQCSRVSDLQIHKYNYTNTQIQHRSKLEIDMCHIFEKVLIPGPKKQCSQVSDLQIHKYIYTNTALVKIADRHAMCYIFEKGNDSRTSKTMFPGVWQIHNTQIQIYKYTNTVLVKVAYSNDMCYVFKKVMLRGPQKQCSRCLTWKYTNTNTQIQHWSNTC